MNSYPNPETSLPVKSSKTTSSIPETTDEITLADLTDGQFCSMDRRERRAYMKRGVVPARFLSTPLRVRIVSQS